jgi:hypothetical protein
MHWSWSKHLSESLLTELHGSGQTRYRPGGHRDSGRAGKRESPRAALLINHDGSSWSRWICPSRRRSRLKLIGRAPDYPKLASATYARTSPIRWIQSDSRARVHLQPPGHHRYRSASPRMGQLRRDTQLPSLPHQRDT